MNSLTTLENSSPVQEDENNFSLICFPPDSIWDAKLAPQNNPAFHMAMLYECDFFPSKDWWTGLNSEDGITFSNGNLNAAAHCVKTFLDKTYYPSSHSTTCSRWYTLTIPLPFHKKFYHALRRHKGKSFILPFSSWCFGKCQNSGGNAIHHRHVILVTQNMNDIWSTMEGFLDCTDTGLFGKEIADPWQLLDALAATACLKENGCEPYRLEVDSRNYRIHRTLPDCFKWILACLWKGGIYYLRNRLSPTQNLDPRNLPNVPAFHTIFPLSKKFIPTPLNTAPYALYLDGDEPSTCKKLYLETDPHLETLDDDEWGKIQSRAGNNMNRLFEVRTLPTIERRKFKCPKEECKKKSHLKKQNLKCKKGKRFTVM